MSKQSIVERILSDANAEADAIIKDANEKAGAIESAALARAEKGRRETDAEVKRRAEEILERRAATARLDGAKILLKEKRRVVDAVYLAALARLNTLTQEECLALTDLLLKKYAENGDEILFAENYPYKEEAARLPIVAEKQLKISAQNMKNSSGGLFLRGEISDKDLSFSALLEADREENQAAIAAELFRS